MLPAIFAHNRTDMNGKTIPTKQGQICNITNPLPGENPSETYIIIDDVSMNPDEATINIVSITELQRHSANPALTPRKAIKKSELTVIAADLATYVQSWNR